MIKNTITNKLEELPDKQNLNIYICGPTVYSFSHLGHARTYLGFDIIRRILEKKFNKNVILIMNITDIDDKVIAKANAENVNYKVISERFEKLFWDDMKWLDIEYPNIVCHVSEKVKEQQDFVQKLLDKNYAYISNGSVYFNSTEFQKNGHVYPKLRNWTQNQTNQQLLEEAEGKLFIQENKNNTSEKKSPSDWALLKATKENEQCATFDMTFNGVTIPVRFGWHLECSVMIYETVFKGLKQQALDIHWGGKDLQFPHHANELAQLEAYLDTDEQHLPIKAFMHTGHLNINKQKMSKSLNNFTTIQAASEQVTSDQLRLLVLQYPYSSDLEFNSDSIEQAISTERKIKNWIAQVQSECKDGFKNLCDIELSQKDVEDLKSIQDLQKQVTDLYANDFNYVDAVKKLVSYIDETKNFSLFVRFQASKAIKQEFQVLGLHFENQNESSQGNQLEKVANQLADLRQQLKSVAMDIKKNSTDATTKQTSITLLTLADKIRDEILLPQGILIEDKQDTYNIKQIDYESYLMTKNREEKIKQEKLKAKMKLQKEKEAKELEMKRLGQQPASEMFKNDKQYVEFNELGIPTKMINENGETVDVPKSKSKKLMKEYEQRKKLNEKYMGVQQE